MATYRLVAESTPEIVREVQEYCLHEGLRQKDVINAAVHQFIQSSIPLENFVGSTEAVRKLRAKGVK